MKSLNISKSCLMLVATLTNHQYQDVLQFSKVHGMAFMKFYKCCSKQEMLLSMQLMTKEEQLYTLLVGDDLGLELGKNSLH